MKSWIIFQPIIRVEWTTLKIFGQTILRLNQRHSPLILMLLGTSLIWLVTYTVEVLNNCKKLIFLVYDIFDDKFLKSWIKTPIFIFNTIFIVTTFISSLLSIQVFVNDLKLLMSLSFALMLGSQVMTRMPSLVLQRQKWRLLKSLILEEEVFTDTEKETVLGLKKLYRKLTFYMYCLYVATVSRYLSRLSIKPL